MTTWWPADAGAHPYDGVVVSLATKHDKLALIAPAMSRHCGLRIVGVAVDTDALGTFSGEVPRPGPSRQVAIDKARLGMRATGLARGIASEGTFGPLEGNPWIMADTEIVAFVDDERGLEIVEGVVRVGVPFVSMEIAVDRVDTVGLVAAGFPDHGLIVRPNDGWDPIEKGIHDLTGLREAVARCAAASATSRVRVESDFRANHHPTRRMVIAEAADRLGRRLASRCPRCRCPGWGLAERLDGAPCRECGCPTRRLRLERFACGSCSHSEERSTPEAEGVDPAFCPVCNP